MLLENMQRSDLTIYEQAQGFQMMLDMGDSVEEIAVKPGLSKTTVRRRVKMMELDQETLKAVSERQLSLTDFDELAQIEDIKVRNECLAQNGTSEFKRMENALTLVTDEDGTRHLIDKDGVEVGTLREEGTDC